MAQPQSSWYSSGYDLWVIPYKSEWYAQIDWWSQFFLSRNLVEEDFNNGQAYVADIRRFIPNKKTWIYPFDSNMDDILKASEQLALQLGLNSVRIFSLKTISPPTDSDLKWSVVTPD